MNKIIVFLLALLGFSFATKQSAAQYGAPIDYYDYISIQGQVVDQDKEPIPNFIVVNNGDTVLTNTYGFYYFEYTYGLGLVKKDSLIEYNLQYLNIYGKEDDFIPKDTVIQARIRERVDLRRIKMIRKD